MHCADDASSLTLDLLCLYSEQDEGWAPTAPLGANAAGVISG